MEPIFTFRTDRYDFWPIYEAIKAYYPIGLERTEHSIYFQYPGIKRLEALVETTLHQKSDLSQTWDAFREQCEKELNVNIAGTTYGQAPSLSAFVEIATREIDDYIISKELHVALSIIGPFYTIYGMDKIALKESDRYYRQTNRTIISPQATYAHDFTVLRENVEKTFEGYRFVPHFIHQMFIEGLRVRYQDDAQNRVYHALFNYLFDFDSAVAGDTHGYGFDQWVIDDPDWTDHWKVGPPPE